MHVLLERSTAHTFTKHVTQPDAGSLDKPMCGKTHNHRPSTTTRHMTVRCSGQGRSRNWLD